MQWKVRSDECDVVKEWTIRVLSLVFIQAVDRVIGDGRRCVIARFIAGYLDWRIINTIILRREEITLVPHVQ